MLWQETTQDYVNSSNACVLPTSHAAVIDAYPNTTMVEQGTTLVLVCRVVGVPSTTVLSYQWTCPGGSCDAGAVDPEWAAKVQQGNILVVNVRNGNDAGDYTCTVMDSNTQLVSQTHSVTVTSELCIVPWAISRESSNYGLMIIRGWSTALGAKLEVCVYVSDDSQSSTIQLCSTKKEGFVPNMTLWTVKKLCICTVHA